MSGDLSPPKNDAGEVLPHNHPHLEGEARLIRRISDDYIVEDHNHGHRRLSSAVFKNDPRNGYLSVDSEGCILSLGREPSEYVISPQWFGALIISVEEFRSYDTATKQAEKWKIGMVPLEGNGCHAGVWGKITVGQSKSLQKQSEWLVPLEGVEKLASDSPATTASPVASK